MRYEVQITTLIRVIQVDGWRNSLIAQRQDRENRLYRARRTQQVSGHRFGGAYHYTACRITKDRFHCLGFCFIACRRRRTMRVDIANLTRFDSRITQRVDHCQRSACTVFRW
ncbi:hypothetical protein SDC9_185487 [bioreactor metagenome]|uniref:Uncharacterized protein n=1 Tax=bioreactor metagenome TaxID=1076179 RepID=A0A645HHA9_9ZZZZ